MNPVFLSAVEGGDASMEAVTAAMDTVIGLVPKVFTAMTSNGMLALFMGATLVGVGVSVWRKLRRGS